MAATFLAFVIEFDFSRVSIISGTRWSAFLKPKSPSEVLATANDDDNAASCTMVELMVSRTPLPVASVPGPPISRPDVNLIPASSASSSAAYVPVSAFSFASAKCGMVLIIGRLLFVLSTARPLNDVLTYHLPLD
jgi:hypothetical protein